MLLEQRARTTCTVVWVTAETTWLTYRSVAKLPTIYRRAALCTNMMPHENIMPLAGRYEGRRYRLLMGVAGEEAKHSKTVNSSINNSGIRLWTTADICHSLPQYRYGWFQVTRDTLFRILNEAPVAGYCAGSHTSHSTCSIVRLSDPFPLLPLLFVEDRPSILSASLDILTSRSPTRVALLHIDKFMSPISSIRSRSLYVNW